MTEEGSVRRIVVAPRAGVATGSGEVLSVELDTDEDVEWIWSHDSERGSVVTGYRIVPRAAQS